MIKLLCQMISQIFYFVSERETQNSEEKNIPNYKSQPCPAALQVKKKLDRELQINFVNVIIFVL